MAGTEPGYDGGKISGRKPGFLDAIAGPLDAGQKSLVLFIGNHALLRSSRLMQRAYASSRYVEVGCDGRGCCARRALASRTAKSCGPGLPMLRSSLLLMRKRRAGDGGKKARSPRRARRTPLKLIAQGGPGRPAGPVVPAACIFFRRRATGLSRGPALPAPLVFRDARDQRIPRTHRAARPRAHA